jgi:ribonuclease P protein component
VPKKLGVIQEFARRVDPADLNAGSTVLPPRSQESFKGFLALRTYHETHVPTFQSQARPYARFPRSHENAWRPSRDCSASCQGPQAPGRLIVDFQPSPQASALQRLKTRAQFQAVLAGNTVARTPHFALHRQSLEFAGSCLPDSKASFSAGAADTAVLAAERSVTTKKQSLFPVIDLWLGAMVPKRWAKKAVTRNAIKRQIYNVSSDFSPQDRRAAFVVRLRRGYSRTDFQSPSSDLLKQSVRAELQSLLNIGGHKP